MEKPIKPIVSPVSKETVFKRPTSTKNEKRDPLRSYENELNLEEAEPNNILYKIEAIPKGSMKAKILMNNRKGKPTPRPEISNRLEEMFSRISPSNNNRENNFAINASYFQSKFSERLEGDTQGILKSRLVQGISCFKDRAFDEALIHFCQAENMIEASINANKKVSFETLFCTYYDLVAARYQLKEIPEALEAANNALLNYELSKAHRNVGKRQVYNFNDPQDQIEYLQYSLRKSHIRRLKCKLHLQACLLNSEQEKHKEALCHAREAAKMACKMLTNSLLNCYRLYLKYKEGDTISRIEASHREKFETPNRPNLLELFYKNPDITLDLTEKTIDNDIEVRRSLEAKASARIKNTIDRNYMNDPVSISSNYKEFVNRIKDGRNLMPTSNRSKLLNFFRKSIRNYNFEDVDMANLYSSLPSNHFIYTTNILALMNLAPIEPTNMGESRDLLDELHRDKIIDQILLFVTSIYAISTEARFWDDSIKPNNQGTMHILMGEYFEKSSLSKASELWVGRSLEFAFSYLPHNCLLADQIFNIYSRLYNPMKAIIPEEEEVISGVKYLTPAKGIPKSANFFIPIIKKDVNDFDIETLLLFDKEISQNFAFIIKETSVVNKTTRYFDIFVKNYSHPPDFRDKNDSKTRLSKMQPSTKQGKRPSARVQSNREDSLLTFKIPLQTPNNGGEERTSSAGRVQQNNFVSIEGTAIQNNPHHQFIIYPGTKPSTPKPKTNVENSLTNMIFQKAPKLPARSKLKLNSIESSNKNPRPPSKERLDFEIKPFIKPSTPMTAQPNLFNIGPSRKVDININNNINVIITNNNNSNTPSARATDTIENSFRKKVPRPPSSSARGEKNPSLEPNRPISSKDKGHRRSLTLKEGPESLAISKNEYSRMSQGSTGSDIPVSANILDSIFEDKKPEVEPRRPAKPIFMEKGPIKPSRKIVSRGDKFQQDNFKLEEIDMLEFIEISNNSSAIVSPTEAVRVTHKPNISFDFPSRHGSLSAKNPGEHRNMFH